MLSTLITFLWLDILITITLYRSIPHAALKEALETLIREAYKVRDSEYIVADTNGNAYWSNIPTSSIVLMKKF